MHPDSYKSLEQNKLIIMSQHHKNQYYPSQ